MVNEHEPKRHFRKDHSRYTELRKRYGSRPEYSGKYRKMKESKNKIQV